MNVLFSILIPAYKSAFLDECIDSILKQTYKNFEVIIVDDASPEDIKSIIDKNHDDRIRYFRNEKNYGAVNVVDNWNKCLSYAEGEYAICMGDDDCLLPNCLEEYKILIDRYPRIGILHGWTEIIDENSKVIQLTTHRCEYESAMSLLWHRVHAYQNQYIGDFCYRISDLRNHGGFYKLPLAWGSDDISAIIAASSSGIANTQNVVFQYRRNSMTISSSNNYDQKVAAVNIEKRWLGDFLEAPCSDIKDELYRRELMTELERFEEKKIVVILSYDYKNGLISRFLHWIKCKHEFDISNKVLMLSVLRYFAYLRNSSK